MIVALDVHYTGSTAHAAAVGFDEWQSDKCIASYTAMESPVAEYEPGKFCVRELSPLLKVIRQIDSNITTYVIDGYCHLSSDLAPGLGAYLHEALAEPTAIVGIAKNRYRQTQHAIEVFRGKSRRPLFVTSIGIEYDVAGRCVQSMTGQFRVPEMLKAVDRLARARRS
ncbi:MAG: endonuclease V [Deltaproteobacteria bacterium]|nr:endonuclease V [Deltaproteobacteria bacterium]